MSARQSTGRGFTGILGGGRPGGIVLVAGADERAGPAPTLRGRVDAGVLDGLPGHLQQQPLLRVGGQRLARAHPEEPGVELGGGVQEPAGADVGVPGTVRVRVERDPPPYLGFCTLIGCDLWRNTG